MSACVDGMGVGAEGAGAALELDESPITESVPVLDDDDDEANDCAVLTEPVMKAEFEEEELAAVVVLHAAPTDAGRAGEGEDVAGGALDIFTPAEVGVDVDGAGRRILVRGLG